jgi:hypothetical protein
MGNRPNTRPDLRLLGPAVLVLVTVWLFSPSLRFGFTLDDRVAIELNPQVTSSDTDYLRILGSGLYQDTRYGADNNNLYRPALAMSLALDLQVAGHRLEPRTFHRTNLLLFVACVLAVYWVAMLLFGLIDREDGRKNRLLAFSVAFLFAVLPSHLEVIANIKHREEILALLFALVAWGLTLRPQRGRVPWRPLLVFLSYLIALGSKESAVLLLPCFLLFEWGFGRPRPGRKPAFLAMVLALITYLALRAAALGALLAPAGTRTFFDPSVPLVDRMAMSSKVFLSRYVWDQLVTLELNPSFSSPFVLRHVGTAGPADYMALATVLVTCIAALWAIRRRRSVLAFGWVFFVLSSALTLQSVPIGTGGAFRLVFAGSLGLSLFAVVLIERVVSSLAQPRAQALVYSLVLAVLLARFGLVSRQRIGVFESDRSIFAYAMVLEPSDPLPAHVVAANTVEPPQAQERLRLFEEALRRYEAAELALDQFDEKSLDSYSVVVTEVGFARVESDPQSAVDLADQGIDLFERLERLRGGLFESNIAAPYYVLSGRRRLTRGGASDPGEREAHYLSGRVPTNRIAQPTHSARSSSRATVPGAT